MTREEILSKMAELAAAWHKEKDKNIRHALSEKWFELAESLPPEA